MLKVVELEIFSAETAGSDEIFLGSVLLSRRTDSGVKPAKLRASMA